MHPFDHRVPAGGIELARRLVDEEQPSAPGDTGGQGGPLLVASGERADPFVGEIGDVEQREQLRQVGPVESSRCSSLTCASRRMRRSRPRWRSRAGSRSPPAARCRSRWPGMPSARRRSYGRRHGRRRIPGPPTAGGDRPASAGASTCPRRTARAGRPSRQDLCRGRRRAGRQPRFPPSGTDGRGRDTARRDRARARCQGKGGGAGDRSRSHADIRRHSGVTRCMRSRVAATAAASRITSAASVTRRPVPRAPRSSTPARSCRWGTRAARRGQR